MKNIDYTNIPQNEFGNSSPDPFIPSSRTIDLMHKLRACAKFPIFKLAVLEHIGQNLLPRLNIHNIRTVMLEVLVQTITATYGDKTFLATQYFKIYFRHLIEYAQLVDDPVIARNVLELANVMQSYLQNEPNPQQE